MKSEIVFKINARSRKWEILKISLAVTEKKEIQSCLKNITFALLVANLHTFRR